MGNALLCAIRVGVIWLAAVAGLFLVEGLFREVAALIGFLGWSNWH